VQPFRVRETESPTHTPTIPCPACLDGYPQPCPRITDQSFKALEFDAAGQPIATEWVTTRCLGFVHAVMGTILELRCSACGVPP
jgi:hypothetical protein